MTNRTRHWLHGIFSAIITGGATSGLSSLGILGSDLVGVKVPSLDWDQLAILTASGGVIGMLAYLKQSPLPPEDVTPLPVNKPII